MNRFAHINIIAKDSEKVIQFYKDVFGCRSNGQKRDLKGELFDKLTGIKNVHIIGEHLVLPGLDENRPTLEIFSYEKMEGSQDHLINAYGFSHIAFEVDHVEETLAKALAHGAHPIGELIKADYPDGRQLTAIYVSDCEGNIVEIQNWSFIKPKQKD